MHYIYGKNQHDRIIDVLAKSMRGKGLYDAVITKQEYETLDGKAGEMDLFGIAGNWHYAVVVEVKSHDREKSRAKAYRQLRHAEQYLRENLGVERVFKIYAYRDGDRIATEWYRG